MNTKQFVQLYHGNKVKYKDIEGIIFGVYDIEHVFILIIEDKYWNYSGVYTNTKEQFSSAAEYKSRLPNEVHWAISKPHELKIQTHIISNTPDNCDECGAVGKEPCKINCPNKENE